MINSVAERHTAERVLQAAAHLLQTGGVDALSTRAVATAAGVQPPTLYRQFGDKDGMLDAVAAFVLRGYLEDKRRLLGEETDPLVAVRQMWDLHAEFGLTQPECYQLIYCRPRPGVMPPAVEETRALLEQAIAHLADQGVLTMSVERATRLFSASVVGFVLTNIPVAPDERDQQEWAITRENALSAIVGDLGEHPANPPTLVGRAAALREALRDQQGPPLSPAERALLVEWLNQLTNQTA
ncbi:MAG: TetR/AcrR family transcriptional regulator [Mycobacterium sp.]